MCGEQARLAKALEVKWHIKQNGCRLFFKCWVSEKGKSRLEDGRGGGAGWRGPKRDGQCSLRAALQRALLEDAAGAASRRSTRWAHCDLDLSLKNWCGLTPQCCFVKSICVSDAVILRGAVCVSWRADVGKALTRWDVPKQQPRGLIWSYKGSGDVKEHSYRVDLMWCFLHSVVIFSAN